MARVVKTMEEFDDSGRQGFAANLYQAIKEMVEIIEAGGQATVACAGAPKPVAGEEGMDFNVAIVSTRENSSLVFRDLLAPLIGVARDCLLETDKRTCLKLLALGINEVIDEVFGKGGGCLLMAPDGEKVLASFTCGKESKETALREIRNFAAMGLAEMAAGTAGAREREDGDQQGGQD